MINLYRKLIQTILWYLPDTLFVYVFFYRMTGQWLHLRNPRKFTHKIQWLKLHGRLERFGLFADKYTVRNYVAETIGQEHLIPIIGVWDKIEDIPFDRLPQQFVMKVSKGCGYNYICKDKSAINVDEVKCVIGGWLQEDFYKQEREPQYKPGMARIVAEKYLEDETGGLRDYKFYCSKGVPFAIQVDTDRFTEHKLDHVGIDWQRLDYLTTTTFGETAQLPPKPSKLAEMVELARILSQDFPFVRVDLYQVGETIYFGELTFTPGSGIVDIRPESGDERFGDMIDLEAYKRPLVFERGH